MNNIHSQYLVFNIANNYFAANVLQIEDVIRSKKTTEVPLSKSNITGLSNLRGHIVTAIDVKKTLRIQQPEEEEEEEEKSSTNDASYSVVTYIDQEFYSLTFEGIGDVIEIPDDKIDPLPETVQKQWRFVSHGVFQDKEHLIVLLDFSLFIKIISENKENSITEMVTA